MTSTEPGRGAVPVRDRHRADGSVEIVDAEGRVHFSTEPPYAVDAVGVRRNLRVVSLR